MTVPHPTQPTVTQAPTQATTTSDAQPVTQGVDNSSSPPLDDSSQASKHRKVTGHMGYMRDDEYVKYYKLGKLIPCMVHPFLPIHQLLYYGSHLYMLENSEGGDYDPGNELNMLEESEKKTILKSFTILLNHELWVKEAISAAIEDKELLQVIETHVGKGSCQAHSNDSKALKNSCIKWIQDDLTMLCPGSKQDNFVFESKYQNELKLGNVSDQDFPMFCYQGEFCNPDNLQMGLFRGTFLMQSFRRIFTGPSLVLSKKPGLSSKKRCNAEIIGLTQVTPQSIAYAAVQARLVLTEKEAWTQLDGTFNYRHFYEAIVAVFEEDPDPTWVRQTLNWWNKEVLNPASNDQTGPDKCPGGPSMAQLIKEQRKNGILDVNNEPGPQGEPQDGPQDGPQAEGE